MKKYLKRMVASKIFMMLGVVLVWIPLLAPLFFSLIRLLNGSLFRFDFLMPAELFLFTFIGGIFLIIGSKGSRYRKLIVRSFLAVLSFLIGSQVVAVVTGLANGDIEPAGWPLYLVIAIYILFLISQVVLGIAGYFHCRKKMPITTW